MGFWFSYITLASIYVLLGLSTNLLVGIAGIFSVSQAAVFGVGAYIVAFFLMNDVMSAGVHRIWKDMAAARLNPQPGEVIIVQSSLPEPRSRKLRKFRRNTLPVAVRGRLSMK